MSRLEKRFAGLKAAGKKGFVAYISGGDPDFDTSLAILKGLPGAGADIIELGVPFTDPAADGPSVQAAGQRALKAGASMRKVLDMVRRFRQQERDAYSADGLFQPHLYLDASSFRRTPQLPVSMA